MKRIIGYLFLTLFYIATGFSQSNVKLYEGVIFAPAPIIVSPGSSVLNIWGQYAVYNYGASSVFIDQFTLAILKGGVHQFDLASTYNITVPGGSYYNYPRAYGYVTTTGSFTAVARYKISGTWYDIPIGQAGAVNPYSFQVVPPAPTLTWPPNGQTILNDLTPDLGWNTVQDANYFWVQVDNNSNFSSPEAENTMVWTLNWTPSMSSYGTYYWRAKAHTTTNVWSEWSTAWSFTLSQGTISVTITSSPSGCSFTVDGTTYSSTQTFSWTPGSSHTISTTSPQSGGTGTQYVWDQWSDYGGMSHTITPTNSATYTVYFNTQYLLTVNAGTGGSVNPSGSNWRNSNDAVQISATSYSGYTFNSWSGSGSGSYTGTNNPTTVTMYGPITETANFSTAAVRTLTVASSNPNTGIPIGVSPSDNNANGNGTTQFVRYYYNNASVTLTAPPTASGNNFDHWLSDGVNYSTNQSITFGLDANRTLTAVYVTPIVMRTLNVHSENPNSGVSVTANPADYYGTSGGSTPVVLYYVNGSTATLTAPAVEGRSFQEWKLDDVFYTSNSQVQINIGADHTVTAVYGAPNYNVTLEIVSFSDLPTEFLNATESLYVKFRLTNHSGFSITNVRMQGFDDASDFTYLLNKENLLDIDGDGDIDNLGDNQSCVFYGRKLIPAKIWEGRNIGVRVSEINSGSVDIRTSKNISVYSISGCDGQFFDVKTDAYGFVNPSTKSEWKEFDDYIQRVTGTRVLGSLSLFKKLGEARGWCTGMATSSRSYFKDPSIKPIAKETNSMLLTDNSVFQYIKDYHWSTTIETAFHLGYFWWDVWPQTLSDVETRIMDKMRNNSSILVHLNVMNDIRKHDVVPIKLIKLIPENKSSLIVYDNNFINTTKVISMDLTANSIGYAYSGFIFNQMKVLDAPTHRLTPSGLLQALGGLVSSMLEDLWRDGKQLWTLKCPVRLLVTDQYGRHIGFVAGSTFVNEIPGANAFFVPADSIGVDTVASYELPNNLNYTSTYFGYGTGVMTNEILKPTSDTSALTLSYVDVPLTSQTIISGTFDSTKNYVLNIDRDGNGITDTIINPTISNSPPSPFDLISPVEDANMPNISPRLVWQRAIDLNGDPLRYMVLLDIDSTFSSPDSSDALSDTAWTIPFPLSPNTIYYWKVKAWDTVGAMVWCMDPFRKFIATYGYTVNKRWNIVSLPLDVVEKRKEILFPTAISKAFKYVPNLGYTASDTLEVGNGYWLKFDAEQFVGMAGQEVIAETTSVAEGWNLVGTISTPIATSSITSQPSGLITSQFFGYSTGYVPSDTLYPCKGYWVKVNQAGSLILSSASNGLAKSSASHIRIITTSELPPPPPDENSVTIEIPKQFVLEQNYPNPFNPITVFRYQLPIGSQVTLRIYNLLGQEIKTLVDDWQDAGYKTVEWDASNFSSGVYFYRIHAGSFIQTKKLILMR
jgi:hypothetical protein